MNLIEIRKLRKTVADIFWQLKKDHKGLLNDNDYIDIKVVYYDVGMIVAYLHSLNKSKLANKVYKKFMDN